MRNFQCLLFVLKRSYIFYYMICMIVPLSTIKTIVRWTGQLTAFHTTFREIFHMIYCITLHIICCMILRISLSKCGIDTIVIQWFVKWFRNWYDAWLHETVNDSMNDSISDSKNDEWFDQKQPFADVLQSRYS